MIARALASSLIAGSIAAQPISARAEDAGWRAAAGVTCGVSYSPVRLREGGDANYRVYGELCRPAQPKAPSLVMVLLPGGTYNHYYWDMPFHSERYSYVRSMTEAGYTTFNVDRIGTGQSSHPASALVDVSANAFVVMQLVQALRVGAVNGVPYDRVVLVGHSLGTLVAMTTASRYEGSVDGLILTGITHHFNPLILTDAQTLTHPAVTDPRFRDRDPGYMTSRSLEERGRLFFDAADADPKAIAADERYSKDTITQRELGFFGVVRVDGTTDPIRVPVLVAIGGRDRTFCGPVATDCSNAAVIEAQERDHYPNAPVTYYVLPRAGHSINLHLNAHDWYDAARRWLEETFV
jgi:pimeloyl-ACP methyl ester carboxylesterase